MAEIEIQSYTGGIAATNGYACRIDDVCFLVDAPDGIGSWLASTGFRPGALLLTHAHFDHVLDAALIQERFGCPIYAFTDPVPELTLEIIVPSIGSPLKVAPYRVDERVAEGSVLELDGGLRFEILHVPGHSPDSVAFMPLEQNVIFSGDVLMAGGIGRDDLPGGDGELLRRMIQEKLYALGDEMRVLPGHGGPTTIGEEKRFNPFVRA